MARKFERDYVTVLQLDDHKCTCGSNSQLAYNGKRQAYIVRCMDINCDRKTSSSPNKDKVIKVWDKSKLDKLRDIINQ